MIEDLTTLFTTIYAGEDEHAPAYAMGQLVFDIKELPKLVASMGVPHRWWEIWKYFQSAKAKLFFYDFALNEIKKTYLSNLDPLYQTQYENLVLSGQVVQDGAEQEFFLVSGKHDKGFPWGDEEIFWDVLLVIGNAADGYRKYCISDRALPGMDLNVQAGSYRYQGPIFALPEGYATSFKHMRNKDAPLVECQADFTINFAAQPYKVTPFPFAMANNIIAELSHGVELVLKRILPAEHPLGIAITPHTVAVASGSLTINTGGQASEYHLAPEKTFGEAEISTFNNVRYPTMLYGYICALRPEARMARVQIHSNCLRTARQRLVRDQIEALLGAIISRVASKEMLMSGGAINVRDLGPQAGPGPGAPRFIKLGDPLLEINNDHFPTADFQRRIIQVQDPSGETCLALEEDMALLRREAENSTKKVTVASIKDPDKFKALDAVLTTTGFLDLVTAAQAGFG